MLNRWIPLAIIFAATRSLVIVCVAKFMGLPGVTFAFWILARCPQLIRSGCYSLARSVSVSPVESVRFFEFDFASRLSRWRHAKSILDVSSPRLFSIYCASKKKKPFNIVMLNPDTADIAISRQLADALNVNGSITFVNQYADKLEWDDKSFDLIYSISVIEHIPMPADIAVLSEMQRVMKPGARLILTVPFDTTAWDEYRPVNEYKLVGIKEQQGKFFFQRWYDRQLVNDRIIKMLPEMLLISESIYGEKAKGWFRAYINNVQSNRLSVSKNDPILMVKNFKKYSAASEIKGQSIICMCFEKKAG